MDKSSELTVYKKMVIFLKVDSCLVTVSIDRRQLPIALLGWYHPCKIGFNGGIGFEIEIFHQHVEHGG